MVHGRPFPTTEPQCGKDPCLFQSGAVGTVPPWRPALAVRRDVGGWSGNRNGESNPSEPTASRRVKMG
jgi:hypothetical protein